MHAHYEEIVRGVCCHRCWCRVLSCCNCLVMYPFGHQRLVQCVQSATRAVTRFLKAARWSSQFVLVTEQQLHCAAFALCCGCGWACQRDTAHLRCFPPP